MERHRQLDGLRGLAALVVVFHHWSLVVPGFRQQLDDLYLPRLLVAGPQSVTLFFVLSGFVLFQAYQRYAGLGYARWCCWRGIRLMVPTIACVSLSALFAWLLAPQPVPGLSKWFNSDSWAVPVTALEWLRNIVPLDGRANHQLDNAAWSLVLEVRYSLLFPLLAAAVTRSWLVTLVTAAIVSLFTPPNPTSAFDMLWTSRYVVLFVAGAALSLNRARLQASFARVASRPLSVLLLLVSLAAIISDPRLVFAPAPIVCAGAILLVAVCAFDPWLAGALQRRPLGWLGRVSFSLYLIHLPVLLAFVHLLHGMLPVAVIALVALPATLGAAGLIERWVERPALKLSRRVLTSSSGRATGEVPEEPLPAPALAR